MIDVLRIRRRELLLLRQDRIDRQRVACPAFVDEELEPFILALDERGQTLAGGVEHREPRVREYARTALVEEPRSAPVVGGLVLSLMTLPVIIIASRAALMAVPPSIRDAALALGASKMQAVLHHVLPLAMPGMLTGTIIGMARALGESAPLLMIGMVAFIVDVPDSPLDPATALPVQVYLWADSPERAFVERTSAAILVLLVFLLVMNATAIMLRKRFERRF